MKREANDNTVKRVYAKCSQGLHTAAKIAAASVRPSPMKLEDYAAQAIREKVERDGIAVADYDRPAPMVVLDEVEARR